MREPKEAANSAPCGEATGGIPHVSYFQLPCKGEDEGWAPQGWTREGPLLM